MSNYGQVQCYGHDPNKKTGVGRNLQSNGLFAHPRPATAVLEKPPKKDETTLQLIQEA